MAPFQFPVPHPSLENLLPLLELSELVMKHHCLRKCQTSVFNTTPYPSIPATTTIPGVILTTITSTAFSTFYKDKEHSDEVYPYTTLTITTVVVNLASSSSSPSTPTNSSSAS